MKYLDRRASTALLRERGIPIGDNQLADLAYEDRGPRCAMINGRALYTEADLLAWIAEQAAKPIPRRRRSRAEQSAA